MAKYKFITIIILVVTLFSSCGTLYEQSKIRSTSLVPDVIRLDMNIEQLELLGEQKISVNYRTYLGFIHALDSINDVAYDRRNINKVVFKGSKDFILPRYLSHAASKVIEIFPNADYYVPVYSSCQESRMFLGRKTRKSMIIKAYKFK